MDERVNQIVGRAAGDAKRSLGLTAVILCVAMCGCRTTEKSMFVITRAKSPVTFNAVPVNQALLGGLDLPAQLPTNVRDKNFNDKDVDHLDDLKGPDPIVVVCISGGGARAARLATHALAELEKAYNKTHKVNDPLINRVRIWSTVSGGSLYSSWVATVLSGTRSSQGRHRFIAPAKDNLSFEHLETNQLVKFDTQYLGAMAAAFYFSPFNLGYAPILLTFSEWDTLNLFARTHDILQDGVPPIFPFVDLPTLPPADKFGARFFFNSTIAENGRPFVFTGSAIHNVNEETLEPISGATNPLLRWIKSRKGGGRDEVDPLPYATTLEDIGSSPGKFPMSYAAMASAAFPFAFNPVTLNYYRTPGVGGGDGTAKVKSSFTSKPTRTLELVDGGIYDNTGVTTALELVDFIGKKQGASCRFFLLIIDANTDESKDVTQILDSTRGSIINLSWPIRGVIPGGETISQIYSVQKALSKQIIVDRLANLRSGLKAYHVDYLEMNLSDAPDGARNTLRDRLEAIPTDFVVTADEDATLLEFVQGWLASGVKAVKYSKISGNVTLGATNAQAFLNGVMSGSILPEQGASH